MVKDDLLLVSWKRLIWQLLGKRLVNRYLLVEPERVIAYPIFSSGKTKNFEFLFLTSGEVFQSAAFVDRGNANSPPAQSPAPYIQVMTTGIYIDDSGNPGLKSKSKYDSFDRKSWMSLILTPKEREDAESQMLECIHEIKILFNANEFHFTDIYSGKKEFTGVKLEQRLGIFMLFAEVFKTMQYPMILQTFTSDDILRNKIIISDKKVKFDNFKLSDPSEFALFFLLFRIKRFLELNKHISHPVEIFIDEGRQKKNTTQECELLGNLLLNKKIKYKSSHDEPLLQLVDYVSFSLNKTRWILTNNLKSDIDKEMLQIFAYANFNVLNIKKQHINFEDNLVEHYDMVLKETYDLNSNLDDIELEELKKWLLK